MNRRTIIAMAFCLAVFLAWGPLMRRLGWVAPPNDAEAPRDQAEEQAETVPDASAPPEEAEDQEDEEQPTSLTPESPPTITSTPSKPPAAEGAVRPSQPRSVRPRETAYLTVPDILQASVDLQRGGISQVRLMKYLAYDREQLVSLGSYRFPYCVLTVAGDEWSLGNNAEIVRRDESTLIIRRRGEHRAVLCEEQWSVDSADSYRVRYSVTLVNDGSEALTFRNLAVAMGGLTAASGGSSPKLARVGRVDLGVELSTDLDKRPQSYSAKDVATLGAEQREEMSHQETQWAAVHNKYFMFYLAAESAPFSGCQLTTTEITDATEDASDEWLWGVGFLPPTTLAPGERRTLEFSGYVGPKEYKRLRALGRGVESVMRLDLFMFWRTSWMGVISKTILRSLIWLRGVIGHPWGYGVAIILITVVIKMLFWPLTHKSTVSMRRMQQLQPLIQEIRERHKDDPQLMNRKVMELYREHKVNPLGGCLPILLQIPVFFALFNTLRGAIELRHASFLWVADLSLPDTLPWEPFGLPLRPLAILMGVSMLLQQKLSPTSSNPSQTRMMTFMSIFFMFIFYSMPAGLTLYWTTNQLLTIGQNLVTRQFEKRGK